MSGWSRLPVRVRVPLAFAGVMAVVLTATGLFLFLRLGAELDATIEQSLRSRAGDVTALIEQADSGLEESGDDALTEQAESFAQILDRSGAVVDATPGVGTQGLLESGQLPDEVGETVIVDREAIPGEDDPVRLLVTPVRLSRRFHRLGLRALLPRGRRARTGRRGARPGDRRRGRPGPSRLGRSAQPNRGRGRRLAQPPPRARGGSRRALMILLRGRL